MYNLLIQDDNQLVRLTLNGDKRGYEAIIKRYQKIVYNVVLQITRDKELAYDVTQETFLKAYQALSSFKSGYNLKPWLLRIATNNALNAMRSNKNVQSLETLLEEVPSVEPKSKLNVEAEVENKLMEEKLNQIIADMQPRHRHLFLLRYQHDLSYEEIAEVLEQPVTTIKSLLFRIRSKVRLLIAQENIEQIG